MSAANSQEGSHRVPPQENAHRDRYIPLRVYGYDKAVKLLDGRYGILRVTFTREEWEQRFGGPRRGARRLRSGSGSGLTELQEAAVKARFYTSKEALSQLEDIKARATRRKLGPALVEGILAASADRPSYAAMAKLMPLTKTGRPMSKGGAEQHFKAACRQLGTTPEKLYETYHDGVMGRIEKMTRALRREKDSDLYA